MACGAGPGETIVGASSVPGGLVCGLPLTPNPHQTRDMAEYTGPATDNEAVVIATMDGRKVPDRYAIGDSYDPEHDNNLKFGTAHAKRIHNDIHERYGQDAEEGYSC